MSIYIKSVCGVLDGVSQKRNFNRNEVFRNIITKKKSEIFEKYLIHRVKTLGVFELDCVSELEYCPVGERKGNDCHKNAAAEYIKTGNEVVVGYVIVNYGSFANVVVHSVNYDEKKQTFYDTGSYTDGVEGWISRIFFPFKITQSNKKKITDHLFERKDLFPDLVMFIDGNLAHEYDSLTKILTTYEITPK